MTEPLTVRKARPEDYGVIAAALDDWWDREVRGWVHHLTRRQRATVSSAHRLGADRLTLLGQRAARIAKEDLVMLADKLPPLLSNERV